MAGRLCGSADGRLVMAFHDSGPPSLEGGGGGGGGGGSREPWDSVAAGVEALQLDGAGLEDRLARRVDTVVVNRCDAILPVLERSTDCVNHMGVLRTAEALGLQDVWIVEPALPPKNMNGQRAAGKGKKHRDLTEEAVQEEILRNVSKRATEWLDVRRFKQSGECLKALRAAGYEVWATDLSQTAHRLDDPQLRIPDKLAIIFGREADGVSAEMLEGADKRVYLPQAGFADSLNVSVAAALVLQQVFFLRPDLRGVMDEGRRAELRARWYASIARNEQQREHFLKDLLPKPPNPFHDPRRPDVHRLPWLDKKLMARQSGAAREKEGATGDETPVH